VYIDGERPADRGASGMRMQAGSGTGRSDRMAMAPGAMMRRHTFSVSEPSFNPDLDRRTVSLFTRASTDDAAAAVEIEVVMEFDYLLRDMPYADWWRSWKTFLVGGDGQIYVSTTAVDRRQLGETEDPVEIETMGALQDKDSGTLRGSGHPPKEVSGFYRLQEAPWYLVVFAPGEVILQPIVRFRNYYFLTLGVCVLAIVLLIRRVTRQVTGSVRQLSAAAGDIARGEFDIALPERTADEIGALTHDFNIMAAQLQERRHLRQSLDLAKEVQQNLLPRKAPVFPGLDVAGRSDYCEETGGDYFDYIAGRHALRLIVGDVAGHGIASALLMSSVRATLRQRCGDSENIAAVISDVNRHLVADVGDSGRFVTLLVVSVNPGRGDLHWVRAGHDPGMLYRRGEDRFEELGGPGLALGVDPEWSYEVRRTVGLEQGDIVLLGTDGIWEARDCEGDMFGKASVEQIVRDHAHQTAEAILEAVFAAVGKHVCEKRLADDMTLIVLKIISRGND
jgi:sigma-B regulation protein RsbU (phosphoserine phosphatase)